MKTICVYLSIMILVATSICRAENPAANREIRTLEAFLFMPDEDT